MLHYTIFRTLCNNMVGGGDNETKPKIVQKDSDAESLKSQTTGNVSVQISDCEIAHPNMPTSSSKENLIPRESDSRKGFFTPSDSKKEISKTPQPKPGFSNPQPSAKATPKRGFSNPSFSIETVSSEESLPDKAALFHTDPKPRALYHRGSFASDTLSTGNSTLTLPRPGSLASATSQAAGQLRVPHLSGKSIWSLIFPHPISTLWGEIFKLLQYFAWARNTAERMVNIFNSHTFCKSEASLVEFCFFLYFELTVFIFF